MSSRGACASAAADVTYCRIRAGVLRHSLDEPHRRPTRGPFCATLMKTAKDDSVAATLVGLIVLLFAALLFAVLAFFIGGRPVADAARTAWRASSLVEVPATVLEARIDGERTRYGSKGRLKALHAEYTYEWQGVRHRSTLVSLQQRPGTYNSLNWHDEWFAKLDLARRTRAPVPAWVSPHGEPEAVLDKDVRYEGMWLSAGVLLLCGGISAVFVVAALMVGRSRFRGR